jgi:hypothetical protein
VLGDDHPGALAAARSLADELSTRGERERARTLAEDVLRRLRRVLGADLPTPAMRPSWWSDSGRPLIRAR